MSEALRTAARAIFTAAMQAVDVRAAVRRSIAVRDGTLHVAAQSFPLNHIDKMLIVALGKAAMPMAEAAIASIGNLPCRAIVVAPPETLTTTNWAIANVQLLPGDHPTPTTRSLLAGDEVLRFLRTATERTAVLFLISGGASAMVEKALDPAISLDDLAVFSRALVGSGLSITEMNTLRKHLSAVKGGRLAQAAAAAAMQCTLLISDVPAASPDAIGSGPSLPDSTTVADAKRLAGRLQQVHSVPSAIQQWFGSAELPETPKPSDHAFARTGYEVILSSEHFAAVALQAAQERGFYTIIDNTCDDWEHRDAARYLLDRSRSLGKEHRRTCIISVGEIGVSVPPHAGEGGRNQHFALWCAAELARRGQCATVLSTGSDGVDGHSSAAGAACDETTTKRASELGFDVTGELGRFNSTPLLHATGDVIDTGPTSNNLRDLRLVLTE